ncbi:hypothetical protein [Ferriphaselus sp. R-1]|uniref:hypothetical protein n=1 Tax=Ferriphaselus sp. R-1 TaxID=1485544 RepID=UPI0013782ED1|nr:hypothetical protein [Ferriphaselus sp. R-1]
MLFVLITESGVVEVRDEASPPSGACLIDDAKKAEIMAAPDRAAIDALLSSCEVQP